MVLFKDALAETMIYDTGMYEKRSSQLAEFANSKRKFNSFKYTKLYNEEAEQSLLGALMLDNKELEVIVKYLHADAFINPVHAIIFKAIVKLHGRSQAVDPITLKPLISNHPALDEVGGMDYLVELVSGVALTVKVLDYAKLIRELFLRRTFTVMCKILLNATLGPDQDIPMKVVESVKSRLTEIAIAINNNYEPDTKAGVEQPE